MGNDGGGGGDDGGGGMQASAPQLPDLVALCYMLITN
jgi:hypothetical protein